MKTQLAICTVAAVFLSGSAMAKEPDPAEMMKAYEKAGTPGDQHKTLQRRVGKWDVTMKSWMDPKGPPMESKGTAEVKPILGDRFIQTTFTGTVMEKPFNGVGVTGYDNTKKKFIGTWIDSMSTGIMRTEGTLDKEGVLTSQAVGSDPISGKDAKTRIVERWDGEGKVIEEFYEKKGGKETKTMEITYTKAK